MLSHEHLYYIPHWGILQEGLLTEKKHFLSFVILFSHKTDILRQYFLRKIKLNMIPNAISVPYLGNCIICYILNIEKVIGTSLI